MLEGPQLQLRESLKSFISVLGKDVHLGLVFLTGKGTAEQPLSTRAHLSCDSGQTQGKVELETHLKGDRFFPFSDACSEGTTGRVVSPELL